MPISLLKKWAQSAEFILAADAGLDRLHEVGLQPNVVIGDFDSTQNLGAHKKEIVRDPDESKTDCDKLLTVAEDRGIRQITLASVEGDHLDHMLATLQSAAKTSLDVRVALRTGIGWILNAGDQVTIDTEPGRRVSLVPLEETKGATLAGVKWPLEDAELHPSGMSGISNAASESRIEASIRSGSAFLFVGFPEEEMPLW